MPNNFSKYYFIVMCTAENQIWYRYWIKPCTLWQSNFILTCWLLALHLQLLSQRVLSERSCIFFPPKKMTWNKFRTPKNNVGFVIHKTALRREKKKMELRFLRASTQIWMVKNTVEFLTNIAFQKKGIGAHRGVWKSLTAYYEVGNTEFLWKAGPLTHAIYGRK